MAQGSKPRELAAQLCEAHAPEAQRVRVEGLEIEVGTFARLRFGPRREPLALTDLVGDRLARKSEVAIDLRLHEVLREARALDHERQRELRVPPLARVIPLALGDRQL